MRSNDLKLKSSSVAKQKKFHKLLKEKRSTNNLEKVVFKFSKYILLDCKKSLLTKSLNFSILCKNLDCVDYLVNFELFVRDIRNLDILANEDLDFVEAKTKETGLWSSRAYNNNVTQNLSNDEFIALQNLSRNKDSIIQKSVVIVERQDYIKKMNNILKDQKNSPQ